MIQHALANYPFTWLACGALLLFAGIFTGAVAVTFGRKAECTHRHAEFLPLEDQ